MKSRNLGAKLIRTLVREDFAAAERLCVDMERAGTTAEFFGAVFYVLIIRRFRSADPHGDIITFVGSLRGDHDTTGDEIDPAATEKLIHVVIDDDPVDPRVDPEEAADLELLIVRQLLADANLSDDQLNDVFAEAQDYLDRVLERRRQTELQRTVDRIIAAQRAQHDV